MNVVQTDNLTKVYGTTRALDGVCLGVPEGSVFGFLGPNGAGKTTLLQLVSATMHPTTGVVGLLGEVMGAVDVFELRPRIGVTSAVLADRNGRVYQRSIMPDEIVIPLPQTETDEVLDRATQWILAQPACDA